MTGDQAALARARQIFELVVYGWDTDPTHPCPGGSFWTQAPWSQDRNTVSNGPGAELGLQLYELTAGSTEKAHYLEWSTKMYDWVNGCLLAPNGLYWDHINLAGDIDKTQWSYNQGTMIGANALFYRITGDHVYLDRANAIAMPHWPITARLAACTSRTRPSTRSSSRTCCCSTRSTTTRASGRRCRPTPTRCGHRCATRRRGCSSSTGASR